MALLLLVGAAHALDLSHLQAGASVGYEAVVNDPFLYRRGVRFGWHLAPTPWVELGASLASYPILGQGGESDPDWKPLSKQLLLENSVSPDISKLDFQAQWLVRVYAIRYAITPAWTIGFGGTAGFAVFHSVDDLVALQNDDESAVASQSQLHPGTVGGVFFEARHAHVGVRVRFETDAYIETVNSTTIEMKDNDFLGEEVMFWF